MKKQTVWCPHCETAFDIVATSVEKPEITVMVRGPSGSRKSTFINMVKHHLSDHFEFYGEERHIRGDVPTELIRVRAKH